MWCAFRLSVRPQHSHRLPRRNLALNRGHFGDRGRASTSNPSDSIIGWKPPVVGMEKHFTAFGPALEGGDFFGRPRSGGRRFAWLAAARADAPICVLAVGRVEMDHAGSVIAPPAKPAWPVDATAIAVPADHGATAGKSASRSLASSSGQIAPGPVRLSTPGVWTSSDDPASMARSFCTVGIVRPDIFFSPDK